MFLFSANDMGITLVTVCLYVYLHLYEKSAWFNFNLDDHLIACKLIFYTHLYIVEYACIYMKCMVDLRLINISSNISHGTSKIFIQFQISDLWKYFIKFGFTCISTSITQQHCAHVQPNQAEYDFSLLVLSLTLHKTYACRVTEQGIFLDLYFTQFSYIGLNNA